MSVSAFHLNYGFHVILCYLVSIYLVRKPCTMPQPVVALKHPHLWALFRASIFEVSPCTLPKSDFTFSHSPRVHVPSQPVCVAYLLITSAPPTGPLNERMVYVTCTFLRLPWFSFLCFDRLFSCITLHSYILLNRSTVDIPATASIGSQ